MGVSPLQGLKFKHNVAITHANWENKVVVKDTWRSLAPADEVEASCIYDAGLASPCQVQLQRHLEEHEGRVNAVLIQLQHVAQLSQPSLGCTGRKIRVF